MVWQMGATIPRKLRRHKNMKIKMVDKGRIGGESHE
jgi:hypothetical protein